MSLLRDTADVNCVTDKGARALRNKDFFHPLPTSQLVWNQS
jgi:hypothetical protein